MLFAIPKDKLPEPSVFKYSSLAPSTVGNVQIWLPARVTGAWNPT
jgi:hypothetical protein